MEWMLGHLIGDYLLQPKTMALQKAKSSSWAILHVFLYTVAVCTMTWTWDIWVIGSIFIPHYLIDRYSFAGWYILRIKGRTFMGAYDSADGPLRDYDIVFTGIVYTVVDNTFHLLCLWIVFEKLM